MPLPTPHPHVFNCCSFRFIFCDVKVCFLRRLLVFLLRNIDERVLMYKEEFPFVFFFPNSTGKFSVLFLLEMLFVFCLLPAPYHFCAVGVSCQPPSMMAFFSATCLPPLPPQVVLMSRGLSYVSLPLVSRAAGSSKVAGPFLFFFFFFFSSTD